MFSQKDNKSLKSLSRNKDLVVCKPDKGRGVVIHDKPTYVLKMTELISDSIKFEIITDTIDRYTRRMKDKLNNFLHKIRSGFDISEEVYKGLLSSGSSPSILFGLLKIHKPDFATQFQFCPIFAAYNSPFFKISQFIVPHFSQFATNAYSV